MHLIVGSTGRLGGRIATLLLERGVPVRALVRAHSPERARVVHTDPERLRELGADIAEGDLTRPESLVMALEGITHVVSTASSTKRGEAESLEEVDVEGTSALARLAAAAGVRQFVYVSAHRADASSDQPIMREKGLAERGIAASGVAATIVRPSAFMQDWIGFTLGAQVQATAASGTPRVQLIGDGDLPIGFSDEGDVARLVLAVLEREDTIGEAISLTAETATYRAVVQQMSQRMGMEIAVETLPVGSQITTVPDELAGMLTFMLTISAGWRPNTETTPEVAERFGLELTTIDAFLKGESRG